MDYPDPFLEIKIHDIANQPGLTGLCAGYEKAVWRHEQLARHLIEWLPFFALSHSELRDFKPSNSIALLAKAAEAVYTTKKKKNRGEIGELLLHIAICQAFNSIPAISKIRFKDSPNITVKGFDAVHVVSNGSDLELWLGEVKFYKGIKAAIRDVISELKLHTQNNYLRSEFLAITNKIEDSWTHAKKLKALLNRNTSLDKVFSALCIPVMLTYESSVIAANTVTSAAFEKALLDEIKLHYAGFCSAGIPKVKIHLFLLPLGVKTHLVDAFDERLKACQKSLT